MTIEERLDKVVINTNNLDTKLDVLKTILKEVLDKADINDAKLVVKLNNIEARLTDLHNRVTNLEA